MNIWITTAHGSHPATPTVTFGPSTKQQKPPVAFSQRRSWISGSGKSMTSWFDRRLTKYVCTGKHALDGSWRLGFTTTLPDCFSKQSEEINMGYKKPIPVDQTALDIALNKVFPSAKK